MSDLSFETENGENERARSTELEGFGVRYEGYNLAVELGKITLQFGYAKETDLGYFGDSFIQDYELDPGYGMLAEYSHGNGHLATSVFSVIDGERQRGFALQYAHAYTGGLFHVGARFLFSDGAPNAKELGLTLGLAAEHRSGLEMIAEAAVFKHGENSEKDGTFATLGVLYAHGSTTYRGVYSQRQIGSQPVEHFMGVGVGVELDEGTEISFGIGRELSSEEKFSQIGFSVTKKFDR